MTLGLAQLGGAWPLAASLAAAVTARSLAAGRRRTALNEALHELRRPLQALTLADHDAAAGSGPGLDSTLRMAVAALERLDREINGGAEVGGHAPVEVGPMLESVAARWRTRSEAVGGGLAARWEAGAAEAMLDGDRGALERALDNLLANAFEHGGPRVSLLGARAGDALWLVVSDSGHPARRRPRAGVRARFVARLTGRRRRGHGLRLVRRIAAAHGGELALRVGREGSVATLELPLADADG